MTTILVVDDESLVGDVLSFALEDEGYVVTRASDGRKALDMLNHQRPALVITDYMMPVMNGVELAKAIRERFRDLPPPVILMSGAQADIGRRNGDLFALVVDKPFRLAEMVARIREMAGPTG